MAQIELKNDPPKADNKGNKSWFTLQPLSNLHFDEHYGNFDSGHIASKTTELFFIGDSRLSFIAWVHKFCKLNHRPGHTKAKEIGIRKTMGSTRSQLVAQFLSETFLVHCLQLL